MICNKNFVVVPLKLGSVESVVVGVIAFAHSELGLFASSDAAVVFVVVELAVVSVGLVFVVLALAQLSLLKRPKHLLNFFFSWLHHYHHFFFFVVSPNLSRALFLTSSAAAFSVSSLLPVFAFIASS